MALETWVYQEAIVPAFFSVSVGIDGVFGIYSD